MINLDNILLVVIAVSNLGTAFFMYKTREDVRIIEKATNSLTDRLVASTAKASRAKGNVEGRAAQTKENKIEKIKGRDL